MQLAGPGNRVEIEQNLLNNKVKTITAYYGEELIDWGENMNQVSEDVDCFLEDHDDSVRTKQLKQDDSSFVYDDLGAETFGWNAIFACHRPIAQHRHHHTWFPLI